ncbi:hypothetical protein [Engelhardtia mirabilis]|uniref:Uncharacterized protein n=1 Tax=Engelhardtia mirabilis TaxID=2528011 RepID=A0A518BDT9_9BACT|nr:hypothetical protein Pla133_02110 [Planctomycetes bacterium Pla133]QDU99473.1 hypothetical protein Pla86_02110 [Planctomycetes bacterium Pla86]
MRRAIPFLALLPLAACSTTGPRVVHGDAAVREPLFESLSSLEGEWLLEVPGGEPLVSEFKVSSGGYAVREIMMRGTPNEMTNLYTLDGNGVCMWHFCAAGNTPRMRADGMQDGSLDFQFMDVVDLNEEDEHYMGGMKLVWVDENTIEQHWTTLTEGEPDQGMVMRFTRRVQ